MVDGTGGGGVVLYRRVIQLEGTEGMDDEQEKIRYEIPWLNVLRCLAIGAGIILLFVGLACVVLTGIRYSQTALVVAPLVAMVVMGVTFFYKVQYCTNMIYSPIQEWIYRNVRCVECGEAFAKCERAMERPRSFASFICYCGKCRKGELFETGMFNRLLAFEPNREVESLYEKKYHGEIYRMPVRTWAAFMVTGFFSGLALVSVLAIIPALIYVHYFGPSEEAAAKFRAMQIAIFISILFFWDILYWKSERLRKFLTHPIRSWIVGNVRCPDCGGVPERCDVKLPESFFEFYKYSTLYWVSCENCKKQTEMRIGGFDFLLRFV